MRKQSTLFTVAGAAALLTLLALPALAEEPMVITPDSPDAIFQVVEPLRAGISPPLSLLATNPEIRNSLKGPSEPRAINPNNASVALPPSAFPNGVGGPDARIQAAHSPLVMPPPILNFEAVPNLGNLFPPDTQGDVGVDYYIQWVNVFFDIYDKTTGLSVLPSPLPGNVLFTGLGGTCETSNTGDPITLYDHLSGRWMMSQFTGDNHQCIAVSATSDPLGQWYQYDYEPVPGIFPDYPKFGVWPDGYYYTASSFNGDRATMVGVFERDKMLVGAATARLILFELPHFSFPPVTPWYYVVPGDLDGDMLPPPGAPNYMMSFSDGSGDGPWEAFPGPLPWDLANNDYLFVHEFHTDWAVPANTFIATIGLDLTAIGADFSSELCLWDGNCIDQPDTAQGLDAIPSRLMHKLQYRNFENHQSLVVSHSVDADGDGSPADRAGVRWYEVRDDGAGWFVHQASTFGPDGDSRWMGDVAMDREGGMAIGYSVSSETTYPSIRYAGRLANDPLNTMAQGEVEIIAGGGSQTGADGFGRGRWGDYSTMSVDPVDDCTFWYTQEYVATTGPVSWQTRVASFKFPTCQPGPKGTLEGTVTSSSSGQPLEGVWIDLGNGYNTVTDGAGYYSIIVPPGSYDVTAAKFWYVTQTANGVVVNDGETTVQDFALADATLATIDGYATDLGHGWPLYAKIMISWGGLPVQQLFTNPFDGYYITQLPDGLEYVFEVEVVYEGYDPMMRDVMLAGDMFENFIFEPNGTCSAPGYGFVGLLSTDFEGSFPPAGWSVNTVSGGDWTNTDPGGRGNLTGGTGLFAIVDSDWAGSADSDLLSPVMNVDGIGPMPFSFNYDYYDLGDIATVDISLDGGTWSNIVDFGGASARGPALFEDTIDFTGATTAQLRFHYEAGWSWWWQVDNVQIASCEMMPGAIIAGFVTDANTAMPLDGALVESDTGNMTYAFPTPEDPAIGDGFYALFTHMPGLGPSTREITASYPSYANGVVEETWVPDQVNRQDFALGAGWLQVTPEMLAERVDAGLIGDDILSFINNGTASAHVELGEIGQPLAFDPPTLGPQVVGDAIVPLEDQDLGVNPTTGAAPTAPASAPLAAGDVVDTWPSGLPAAWGLALDKLNGTVWVGNGWDADENMYEYQPDGTPTGNSQPYGWGPLASGPGDYAYDILNGTVWVLDVGQDNFIHEIHPATGPTGNVIDPGFPTSQRGLAYDPFSDTFFAGGWNDLTVYRFDRAGNIIESQAVGIYIAGLAYNPTTGHLFAIENWDPTTVYVLDVYNAYSLVGSFDMTGAIPVYGAAGLDLDCAGNLWAVDQTDGNETVVVFESGEPVTWCGSFLDVDWLELSSYDFMVPPGQTDIDVTYDTTVLPLDHFGLFKAKVTIQHDTPYPVISQIPVYMVKAFHDIPHGYWADAHIHSLAGIRVTKGCGFNNYCPESILNRAQMAVFIVRLTHGPDFVPPPAVGIFADVPLEDYGPFADYIEQLFNDGVTAGCGPDLFCPEDPILRSEMAVFITKAKGWGPVVPTGIFADVPTDHWAAGYIEQIAAQGVSSGCGDGTNYCPEGDVSRAEMAVFLVNGWNIEMFMHPAP